MWASALHSLSQSKLLLWIHIECAESSISTALSASVIKLTSTSSHHNLLSSIMESVLCISKRALVSHSVWIWCYSVRAINHIERSFLWILQSRVVSNEWSDHRIAATHWYCIWIHHINHIKPITLRLEIVKYFFCVPDSLRHRSLHIFCA